MTTILKARYERQFTTIEWKFLKPVRCCMFCGIPESETFIFFAGWTLKTGIWFRCRGHGKDIDSMFDVMTGTIVSLYNDGRNSCDAWMDEEGLPRVICQ